jgi:AmpE protein
MGKILPLQKMNNPWLRVAAVLAPLIIIILLLQILFYQSGFLGFIFDTVILIYCIGANRFMCHIIEIFNHNITDDKTPVTMEATLPNGKDTIKLFYHEIFAVLFWFVILGGLGALLYRVILEYVRHIDISPVVAQNLVENEEKTVFVQENLFRPLLGLLDWPSIRLFGLCVALATTFNKVFAIWKQYFLAPPTQNETVLMDYIKVTCDDLDDFYCVDGVIYRALLIFLVIIALGTIVSWVF